MGGGVGDEMGEAFERDGIAVMKMRGDRRLET